jgi:RNA polymerase sigma-70 factor, ECF subfamily
LALPKYAEGSRDRRGAATLVTQESGDTTSDTGAVDDPREERSMTVIGDGVVEAAGHGDPDALETVYRTLAPRVLGYLRAQGVEDPEGVTDDVFMATIPRLAHVRGGSNGLRTLVFSVAHARAVDEHRRRARWPQQTSYEPALDSRRVASAETLVMEAVSTREVTELLEDLGEEQRAVIMLRVLADLSLEQTAEVLGRSVGSVKQLQRRGLLRLKALLDGQTGRTA